MNKNKEDVEITRQKIFLAGLQVFSRKGFSSASLCDIAREAKLSRGAIYWHYRNKEAFFIDVFTRVNDYLGNLVSRYMQRSENPLVMLQEAMEDISFQILEDPEFRMMHELLLSLSTAEIEQMHDSIGFFDQYEQKAVKVLDEAIREGLVYFCSSPKVIMYTMNLHITGLVQLLKRGSPVTRQDLTEMIEMMIRGMCPDHECVSKTRYGI